MKKITFLLTAMVLTATTIMAQDSTMNNMPHMRHNNSSDTSMHKNWKNKTKMKNKHRTLRNNSDSTTTDPMRKEY